MDNVKQSVKQKKNYNYNECSHYVGFRCPNDLFNSTLKGTNITETLIMILEKHKKDLLNRKRFKSYGIEPEQLIKILAEGIREFNKIMIHNKGTFKVPNEVNSEKLWEAKKYCQMI